MKRATKIWLTVAASLVLLGLAVTGGAFAMVKFDFSGFATSKRVSNTYVLDGEIKDITVNVYTADVAFAAHDEDGAKVVCYETEKLKHSVELKDGTLSVSTVDTRRWYDHIEIFSVGHSIVTVYLPRGEYNALLISSNTGDIGIPKDFSFESISVEASTGSIRCLASATGEVKLKASTGDIEVSDMTADSLELCVTTGQISASAVKCAGAVSVKVRTGKTSLDGVECNSLASSGNTGEISLRNVIASDSFFIERSTGGVSFDACDAGSITVVTDTGDVKGSLLSDKVFSAHTDTGKVRIPSSASGGLCNITTDTGDILIEVIGK